MLFVNSEKNQASMDKSVFHWVTPVALALLLVFVFGFIPIDANFGSAAEEKELADLLQARLTKHTPPAGIVNQTVFVYMSIYQIVDVDEKNGILTMKLWMYTYYRFHEPLWDPLKYNNATRMQFLPDTFWKPDVGT